MRKILFSVFISLILFGESEKIKGYIDIPSANIPKQGIYLNLTTSYPIGEEPEKFDINGIVGFSIGRMEAYLSCFKPTDWSFDIKYLIFDSKAYKFSLGVDRLTNKEFITPLGGGDSSTGYIDEQYNPRPTERFSFYLVNTYKPYSFIEFTSGIGRGKYVGYGPRSKYFNIDIFFIDYHKDYSVGLFWGFKVNIIRSLYGLVEFDGRDVNAGFSLETDMLFLNLSLTKIEQISDIVDRNVRLNLSLGGKIFGIVQSKRGFIVLRVYDDETKMPLSCKVEFTDMKDNKAFTYSIGTDGFSHIELKEGIYKIRVINDGYYEKSGKVNIVKDKKVDVKIGLRRRITPEETLVENKLVEIKNLIKEGKLKDALILVNECMKIIPGYQKTVAIQKQVKDLIKIRVDSLSEVARGYESSSPQMAISIWEEILALAPDDQNVQAKIASLSSLINSMMTKPTPPKTTTTTPTTKPTTKPTMVMKPTQQELTDWYKNGVNLFLKGKYKEAKVFFEKILKYDPNNEKAKKYLEKVKEKL